MIGLKRIVILIIFSIFILARSVFAVDGAVEQFSDVPEVHWANKAVYDLRSLKITDEIGDNRIGMGLTIKRSEFTAFLVKLMKWEMVKPEKGSFTDNMDSNKWYYAPIETALEHGVVIKDTDLYRVEEPITREEMAVMIVRTLGYDYLARQLTYMGNPFEDVLQNTGYITIAKDFGIIAGVGNNLFKPYDTAKREEAAVMMMRMYEKLGGTINELHAFYAIQSANQADMISSLNSVGFGWSRLEYNADSNSIVLNTTKNNNNEYAIPDGFYNPLSLAQESNVSTQLMVFVKGDMVYNMDTKSNIPLVEYILSSPQMHKQVIDSIVSQINSTNVSNSNIFFNGVVIDFESIRGETLKQSLNEFLKELKKELQKNDKLLYVAVHPARQQGQAYFDGYDYKTIGEISDKVILMAHDYYARQLTDIEMQNGYTITPLSPIDEVYYAIKVITDKESGVQDLKKIWIQFSFDSVQWKLKEKKVINMYPYNPGYEAIQKRLLTEDTTINYSEQYQNPFATFFDINDQSDNVIWYEDSRSIQAKISLAKMFGIQGVSLWRLGNIPNHKELESKNIYLDVWNQILQNIMIKDEM